MMRSKDTSVTIMAPSSGRYYFHVLREDANGEKSRVVHYPVNIDIEPPTKLSLETSQTVLQENDVLRLGFSAEDELSGLQKNFYIKFADNNVFLPVKPPLYIPLVEKGVHTFTAKVYDNAGNSTETSTSVEVR